MEFIVIYAQLVDTLRVLEMLPACLVLRGITMRRLEVTTVPLVYLARRANMQRELEIAPAHFAPRANMQRELEIAPAHFALIILIKINLDKILAFRASIVHRYKFQILALGNASIQRAVKVLCMILEDKLVFNVLWKLPA